jgi:hypothetical protein
MALSLRWIAAAAVAVLTFPAEAVDGCKVILCLGGNWRSIPTCVPDVRWALRHRIPSCPGLGYAWAGPGNCPPQYTITVPGADGDTLVCRMTAVLNVLRDNQLWQQVWWSEPEQIYRIWYSDAAKAEMREFDPTWDIEYAAWLASRPPVLDTGLTQTGH